MRHCVVRQGHQLAAIGSELSAGIRNVYIHDCRFERNEDNPPMNLLFIKTNRRRGGFVENIHFENITADNVKESILGIETDVLYQWKDLVPTYEERLTPIRGIHLKGVKVDQCGTPFRILGDPDMPVEDVTFEDIQIRKARGEAKQFRHVESIKESNIRIGGIEESR